MILQTDICYYIIGNFEQYWMGYLLNRGDWKWETIDEINNDIIRHYEKKIDDD